MTAPDLQVRQVNLYSDRQEAVKPTGNTYWDTLNGNKNNKI